MDKQDLATEFIPLAAGMAKPYQSKNPHLIDELKSEAFLGLVDAANKFDADKEIHFYTYAKHRINGTLLEYQRKLVPKGFRRRKDKPPKIVSLEHTVSPASFASDEVELYDTKEFVTSLLEHLSDAQRAAIHCVYFEGRTYRETATVLGITPTRASALCKTGIKKLHSIAQEQLK